MLGGYWSGLPLRRVGPRMGLSNTRWNPISPLFNHMGEWLILPAARLWCEQAGRDLFDAWTAAGISKNKRWDAASLHHRSQNRLLGLTSSGAWRKICQVKDEEMRLADHILTASDFARQSYLDAGYDPNKVHSVPLGADTNLFRPVEGQGGFRERPFTFLFVGALSFLKGADLLLRVMERLAEECSGAFRLFLAGPRLPWDACHSRNGLFCYLGKLTQESLAEVYRRSDCLVLPSRMDSFGLVVLEALSCGTPAIVSDRVGSKYLIRDGVNGWVVPFDESAVLRQMRWCVEHRDRLMTMRTAARATASEHSWSRYQSDLLALFRRIL
jgi:glycosyltransferase involved in cell wall biosynthesis